MKIDATFSISPELRYNCTPVIINVLRGLPVGYHHIEVTAVFTSGMHTHKTTFFGSEYNMLINETPVSVSIRVNGYVENVIQKKDILKMSAKIQLRIMADALNAEHPSRL